VSVLVNDVEVGEGRGKGEEKRRETRRELN